MKMVNRHHCLSAILAAGVSVVVVSLGSLLSSCGTDAAEQAANECADKGYNWRQDSANETVCKGAPGCACGLPDKVCCVVISADGKTLQSSACSDLTSCKGLAFACDGPEDCGSGKVCCGSFESGGGSTCVEDTPNACFGAEKRVLCREEQDCGGMGEKCTPSKAGTFFGTMIAVCD